MLGCEFQYSRLKMKLTEIMMSFHQIIKSFIRKDCFGVMAKKLQLVNLHIPFWAFISNEDVTEVLKNISLMSFKNFKIIISNLMPSLWWFHFLQDVLKIQKAPTFSKHMEKEILIKIIKKRVSKFKLQIRQDFFMLLKDVFCF